MGRKSNLTTEQWAGIGKRLLEGETASALAREFGISEATIRSHFERKGQKTQTIQAVAGKLYEAEIALKTLPMEGQVAAMTLVKRLRNISESLAHAADNSAATAVRFSALANSEAQKVDDANPIGSEKSIKASMVLTKAANEAAHIPLNLLAANREKVKQLGDEVSQGDEVLTPKRLQEGARRIAFMLHKAASAEDA